MQNSLFPISKNNHLKIKTIFNKYEILESGIIRYKYNSEQLKISIDNKGYQTVKINGINKKIHKLMAVYFLGHEKNKNEVIHHKNGIKIDNNINNLQILYKKEHALIHGIKL